MSYGFSPRNEPIGPRDIRTQFALKRFDENGKMHDFLGKQVDPNEWPPRFENHRSFEGPGALFPSWNKFSDFPSQTKPMTTQTFDEFDSDASSQSSGGSSGGQPLRARLTREPRVHHIPILVEARDDNSSGYASDNTTEHHTQGQQQSRDSTTSRTAYNTTSNLNQRATTTNQGQKPCTRSQSDNIYPAQAPQVPARSKKSSSQPPPSPPAKKTDGPFVTKVKIENVEKAAPSSPVPPGSTNGKSGPNPHEQILTVLRDMRKFEDLVKAFEGTSKDKKYRWLDEMLTRCMLKLDDVNTDGNDEVRLKRKDAVKQIQGCISLLESKITGSDATQQGQQQSKPEQNTEDHAGKREEGSGDAE